LKIDQSTQRNIKDNFITTTEICSVQKWYLLVCSL